MNCRMSHLDYLIFLILSALVVGMGFVYSPYAKAQASRTQIESYIVKSSQKHHVDPRLALAIAEVESGFNPNMVGSLGEVGVFQLRPEFHSVVKGNTKQNIDVAIKYLAHLKRQCGDYGDAFFVCYNYGPSRQLKHPKLFPYYKRVQLALKRNTRVIASAD